MASSIVVPFNFCPVSEQALLYTGYTVPAGKYARIRGRIYEGVMSINETAVLGNHFGTTGLTMQSGSATVGSGSGETVIITATSGICGVVSVTYSSAAGVGTYTGRIRRGGIGGSIVGSASISESSSYTFNVFLKTGDVVTTSGGNAAAQARSASIVSSSSSVYREIDVWVTSGDAITFSSTSITSVDGTIEVYNQVT